MKPLLLILLFTLFSCKHVNSQNTKTEINENPEMERILEKLLENEETENSYTLSEEDLSVLSDLISNDLKNKEYRLPTSEEFNNKIQTFFSINTKCIEYEKIGSRYIVFHGNIMDGSKNTLHENLYESYADTENLFFDKKNLIILNFSLLKNIVSQNGQSISINIPQNIIARNKYLFNDNKASLAWLKFNDEYFLESLVKTFGYTQDKDLLDWVMKRNESDAREFVQNNIFVRNCKGELEIREDILKYIEEYTTNDEKTQNYAIELRLYQFENDNNWNEREIFKIKAYIANTYDFLFKKSDNLGNTNKGRISYLGAIFFNSFRNDNEKSWSILKQNFEQNNYYNLPHLKEVTSYALEFEAGYFY